MLTFAVASLALAWANQSNECDNDVLLQVQDSEHTEMVASNVDVDDDDQPCVDKSSWCFSWLCWTHSASCPKTCDKRCQVNCTETPELGECRAKALACELSKKLEVWESKHPNITKVQKELRDLCKNGTVKAAPIPDPSHSESSNSTLLEVAETCDKDTRDCATDMVEALKSKSFLVAQALKAPGWLAKSGVDTLKEVLKATKDIALRGTIAFAFLSAGISAFFPKLGEEAQNPCHGLTETIWAKCVWQQIFPFVQQSVDAKMDDLVEKLWEAKLDGYQSNLWYIHTTVKENTGDKKKIPEKVVNKMVDDLESLHQTMIRDASQFMLPFSTRKVAGLYFSQFAASHYSVMASILANNKYRTAGFRETTQQILMCYATQLVHKTLKAREARLKALEVPMELCGHLQCSNWCKDKCYNFKDEFEGCDFNLGTCKVRPDCKYSGGGQCQYFKNTCPSSTEAKKWTCHVNWVTEQMDNIWSTWLTAVPYYLKFVGQLDAMKVEKQGFQVQGSNFNCPLP